MNIIGGDVLSKCILAGIKGEVNIKLMDSETGRLEFEVEEHNMFFPEVLKPFLVKASVGSILYNLNLFGADKYVIDPMWGGWEGGNPSSHGAMLLSMDDSDEDILEKNFVKSVIGGAYIHGTYSGISTQLGTINMSESSFDAITGKFTMVFDFPTNAANGSFQSVALTPIKRTQDPIGMGKLFSCGGWYPETIDSDARFVKYTDFNTITTGSFYHNFFIGMKDGKLLAKKQNDAATFVQEIDLTTGIITSLGHTLKGATGVNVVITNPVIVDGFLYAVDPNNAKLSKWSLSNLSANATEYNLAALFGTNLYILVFPKPGSATRFYVHPYSVSTNDPAMGEPFYKFIYEVDVAAGTIIRRIRTRLADTATNNTTYSKGVMWVDKVDPDALYTCRIGYQRGVGTGENEDGTMQMYTESSGSSYNQSLVIRKYDLVNEEFVGSLGDLFGVSMSPSTYASSLALFYDWVDNKVKFNSPLQSGSYFVLKEIKFIPKTHRVKLPAPVTKVNTQTMKVTYSITVNPTNLINIV